MDKHFFLIVTLLFVVSLGLVAPATATGSFTVTVQQSTQTISPGMAAAYSITVTSSGGFTSPVTLSLSNAASLPTSISVSSFYPSNTVTPPAGGSEFAIIVVQTTGSTPVDTYQLTISGTGGGFTDSATVVLEVTYTTTFHAYVTPLSQTIGLGYSKQYQIAVASLGDFSSPVALSLMTPPYGISYTITPSTVTPPVGDAATATLEVSVSPDVTPDNYALMVRASLPDCFTTTSDCVDYSFVVVQVPSVTEFQIAVSPSTQSVAINQDASFTVQAASVGGFYSDIQLNLNRVPAGVDFSFNPTTITPTETNPATSTLTISPSTSALAGDYNVDVIGTSQGITKTSTITLTIAAITTQLTLNVPTTAVKRGDTFTVSGSISPVQSGAAINLIYTRPDGSEFTRTVQTGPDGTFSDQYTPQTVDLVGPWKIRDEYVGGGAYSSSQSQVYDFQVVETTFLETYGLLWIADYALWIVLLIIVIVVVIMGVIVALRRRSREEKRRPSSPAPALVPAPTSPSVWQRTPPVVAPTATKVCFNCGQVIAANARFCDKCDATQPA